MVSLRLVCLCVLISLLEVTRAAEIVLPWFEFVGDQGTTEINVGDTVTWQWTEIHLHTVECRGTSSGARQTGSYSMTFGTAGSFPYNCLFHNSMKGVILVKSLPAPTVRPTTRPTPVPTPTQAVPTTTRPSVRPTTRPTSLPTAIPTKKPAPLLTYPDVLRSGSSTPQNWTATLRVRAHRVETEVVSFNTRSYCYIPTIGGAEVCSHPGPTIVLTPGDNLTLLLVNELQPELRTGEGSSAAAMNSMHHPNTTNIHTHGLHVDPNQDSVFRLAAADGGTVVYRYEVPVAHAPGLHWYHAHVHGSTAMQVMGGLAGALIVQPPAAEGQTGLTSASTDRHTPFNMNIPASIRSAQAFLLVVTHLVFAQSTVGGAVSQGCGIEFTCNAATQAPLCYGNETSSPYDPFRVYSYPELAADTQSTLPINAVYHHPDQRDFHLVNGQFQPSITVREGEPFVLRVLHATGGQPLTLTLSDSTACNMSSIAWDGVYLDANQYETSVHLVAATRAELQILCSVPGDYSVVMVEEGGEALLHLVVEARAPGVLSRYAYISDADLASISRPYYLQDLTGDASPVQVDSNYSVTISQDHTNASVCGYWIGAGTDCSTVNPDAPTLCPYHQFMGEQGSAPAPYLSNHKLVTYPGAVNEWKFYGMGSAFHPLHVHVNHFQIVDYNSRHDAGADNYYRRGQWRDTVPPIADVLTFRFLAADYVGETVLHCHFVRHEDLGMMDTYLVTDKATYETIHTASPSAEPTQAPTASPSAYPTEAPTEQPTIRPSAAPSSSPTFTPTSSPTTTPTTAPTSIPTIPPTAAPSAAPSPHPTAQPTPAPSAMPTAMPTPAPSTAPTAIPTVAPTMYPTLMPTLTPSSQPTVVPTASPTSAPTLAPSAAPSAYPTPSPSAPPTDRPTAMPSLAPSSAPTQSPTLTPTAMPTHLPTLVPTAVPTMDPTPAPSQPPTTHPSATPSYAPTPSPTAQPTVRPSPSPSVEPSSSPSVIPSLAPSPAPSISLQPSEMPTQAPTARPANVTANGSGGRRTGPNGRDVIIISVVGSVAVFAAAVLAAIYFLNGHIIPIQSHPAAATIPTAVVAWQDPVQDSV